MNPTAVDHNLVTFRAVPVAMYATEADGVLMQFPRPTNQSLIVYACPVAPKHQTWVYSTVISCIACDNFSHHYTHPGAFFQTSFL